MKIFKQALFTWKTHLKLGISERFLSSKVEFKRLDCIGSCGANTKYQQIFLRTCKLEVNKYTIIDSQQNLEKAYIRTKLYRYPLVWVLSDIRYLIYCLIAATNFKVIIAMRIIPAKMRRKKKVVWHVQMKAREKQR